MAAKLDVNYICPKCRSYLLVWKNIIFSVKSCTEDEQGNLLLNPKLSSYQFNSNYMLVFKETECLVFFCPICGSNLTATDVNKNLTRIIMIDENQKEYDLYFSRLRGEHSTFKISDNNIVEKYGKDSSNYVDYFMSKFEKEKDKKEE